MTILRFAAMASVVALTAFGAQAQDTNREGVFHNKWGTGEPYCVPIPPNAGEDWYRSALWDARQFGLSGPCDPTLEYIDGATWGRTVTVTGTDSAGRTANFRLYLLADRYSWAFASASRLEDQGRATTFQNVFSRPEFFDRMCQSEAVMGLGAASFEGETARNHQLASARANVIAEQVTETLGRCEAGSDPEVLTVSLGEHQVEVAGSTAPQRRVIIVTVEEQQADVILSEALKDAMSTPDLIDGLDIDDYDLFEVAEFG